MKNKNEGLLVAVCLFFVIFLAPFNLMMSLFLALALLSGYLAYRLMGRKKATVRKAKAKRSVKKGKSKRK